MNLGSIIESASEVLNIQDTAVLKRCANLVLGNVAANYIDCEAVQAFTVNNERINYSEFSKTFLKVKSVKIGNSLVDYSLFVDYVAVPNGKVVVTYCYVPFFLSDTEEIVVPGLSEQCFVYGVLTEYAIISGMYNEAKVWGEKFAEGLFNAHPKYKQLRIPRGWRS